MNKKIELQIIRPTSKEVLDVEWIDVQTPTGDFVIGKDHSALVSTLKERGRITYRKHNSKHIQVVDCYGGLLKVESNVVVVILDL